MRTAPLSVSVSAASLPCTTCKGAGRAVYSTYRPDAPCYACEGRGVFTRPDARAIAALLRGRKGLVSRKPDDHGETGRRAAYVWRWARFHGGADVTMPCTVTASGDPYVATLDALADAVARHVYGTDLAAARRWGPLLGVPVPASVRGGDVLPASAYECGPVHDGVDPETCAMLEREAVGV